MFIPLHASVYGATEGGGECNEQSAPNPQTAYARCKVLVEREVGALADMHFSPVFLRNATAFGASPRMRFDIVLNNLAGFAWTAKEIRMTSDGTPWRPLVHVEDICQAIILALEAPRETVHNEIFNVGDDEAELPHSRNRRHLLGKSLTAVPLPSPDRAVTSQLSYLLRENTPASARTPVSLARRTWRASAA